MSGIGTAAEPEVTPAAAMLIGDDGQAIHPGRHTKSAGLGHESDTGVHDYRTLNHAPQLPQTHSQRSLG